MDGPLIGSKTVPVARTPSRVSSRRSPSPSGSTGKKLFTSRFADLPPSVPSDVYVKPQTPSYTFGFRREEKVDLDVPGPGKYNVLTGDISSATGRGVTIKGSRRAARLPDKSPGPGDIMLMSDFDRNLQRGRGPRLGARWADHPVPLSPSPLDYAVETYDSIGSPSRMAKGTTIKSAKNATLERSVSPGPGAYMVPSQLGHKSHGFKIGGGKTRADIRPSTSDSPGPGAYTIPNANVTSPAAPAITLGGRLQDPPLPSGPGPGAYHLPSTNDGPAFTMRPKTAAPAYDVTPGPR